MVKNTSGGSKHKGFARKRENESHSDRIRLSECDLEQYACVTRMNGNNCNVTTIHGIELIGHVRGKMSGRNRRQCNIVKGSVVLIGLRDWERNPKNCDVLEVYSPQEIEQLKTIPKVQFERLLPIIQTVVITEGTSSTTAADDIQFTTNEESHQTEMEDTPEDTTTFTTKYEDINIDDI